jgi:hypothetical protein
MLNLNFKSFYLKGLAEGNKADVFDYTDPVDQSVSKN